MAPKNRPFSIDRKPITCDIALRRVIIVRKASKITATAIPTALRVAVLASAVIGCAKPNENTTTTRPTSIVPGMFNSVSVSQYTPSRRIRRCNSHGRNTTLSPSVRAAERYRLRSPVRQASNKVAAHRIAPCSARKLTSVTTRRCESIANDSSSSMAARLLSNCSTNEATLTPLASEQNVHEQTQHREQERGRKEFGRAKYAQLGRHRLDQRERDSRDGELECEYRNRPEQLQRSRLAHGRAPGNEQRET